MAAPIVTIAVEGALDAAVARRVLAVAGCLPGDVYGLSGKDRLDRSMGGFDRAAHWTAWLVLRDLDRDAACAPELIGRLLPQPAPRMFFRVVVRAVEAWLLADRDSVARWLRVPLARVPQAPEDLPDPKSTLVQLAGSSRNRILREAMVPGAGMRTRVGPGYTAATSEFVSDLWQPQKAALNSPALSGCLRALVKLGSRI